MNYLKLDKAEIVGLILVFGFSFVFFFKDTFMFWYCLMAALITTALAMMTYLMLKWFYLAVK